MCNEWCAKRQLIDIDVFSRSTSGLMGMLSRAITGNDPPPGMSLEFPTANVQPRTSRASRMRSAAAAASQAKQAMPPPPPPMPSAAAESTFRDPQNRLPQDTHAVTRSRGASPASGIPRRFVYGPPVSSPLARRPTRPASSTSRCSKSFKLIRGRRQTRTQQKRPARSNAAHPIVLGSACADH